MRESPTIQSVQMIQPCRWRCGRSLTNFPC
jgi:hypothetical protein